MVRLTQPAMIRAVAHAALEQNKLSLHDFYGVMKWIDHMAHDNGPPADEAAIRKASEVMIRRLRQPSPERMHAQTPQYWPYGVAVEINLGTP